MEYSNQTSVSRFILLGLSDIPRLQVSFFLLFMVTVSGNLLLIIAVCSDTQLQTPMYFFLSNLSFIDICLSSTTVPKILVDTLSSDRSISLVGCAAQMYFFLALGATECITLAVMAYDRYVAICNPLRYATIMGEKLCISLVAGSWTVSFLKSVIHATFTFLLPYCRSNRINHCEMALLLQLSCRDTFFNEIAVYISGGLISLCSFMLTIMSYFHIIPTILKIRSTNGRYKAFSTCALHLTVVSIFYRTIMFMYLRPRHSYSAGRDRVVAVLYMVITPMLNPIIYSIRINDVKCTLRRTLAV